MNINLRGKQGKVGIVEGTNRRIPTMNGCGSMVGLMVGLVRVGLIVRLIKRSRENGQIQTIDNDHRLRTALFQHTLYPSFDFLRSHSITITISILVSITISILVSLLVFIIVVIPCT